MEELMYHTIVVKYLSPQDNGCLVMWKNYFSLYLMLMLVLKFQLEKMNLLPQRRIDP